MNEQLAHRLAENVKQLRRARGATQQQMAKRSGMPRATWSHLESGAANPTLAVLHKVAGALGVQLEELVAAPRAEVRHYRADELPARMRGRAAVRHLLPDPLPGTLFDRMELPPRASLTGAPHTPGSREYLVCERGALELVAAGESYRLAEGDVVVFRGDQRHSYGNPGRATAVGYSVVLVPSGNPGS